jgi:protein dithiol oxidoreductase (disulfide-forming)
MRRVFLIAATCALALPRLVMSQTSQQQEQLKPYLQVSPLASDESVVRVFFSPGCQYSRMYLQFFKNLAATLPVDKKMIYTPLVNKADGVSFAMAFAAVARFYPNHVPNFIEAAMIGVQDKGISTKSWAGLDRIAKAARIPVFLPKLVRDNEKVIVDDVSNYVAVRHNLQVINTPAVAVSGTYVVTPEFTKGDAQLFSQLVNGVISMAR